MANYPPDMNLIECRACPRLVAWRELVGIKKRRAYREWTYWSRPMPAFGDPTGRVLVVGLAPGAHGSNRTGRAFTGDDSGVFLYRSLYKFGFASQPDSTHVGDGLELRDILITAVCRCAPPDNKPTREEISTCRPYLVRDILSMTNLEGCVVLGRIALDGLLAAWISMGYKPGRVTFAHNLLQQPGAGLPWLVTSYHPSRQNTQTGRLTEVMFDSVWERVRGLLEG